MKTLLILPNTLFHHKYIKPSWGIKRIVIWEHPQYFTKYKYNKKRLVLHRASMKYYAEEMKTLYNVQYVNFDKTPRLMKDFLYFDPIDRIRIPRGGERIESPNFLLSTSLIKEYRTVKNTFFFNSFYMWSKKKIDIIPNVKSQDSKNRKPIPINQEIPKLPPLGKHDKEYIRKAEIYVNKYFPNNYGDVKNLSFPISRKTAKKWLSKFITQRFKKFGDYQDYTLRGEHYLFHSCLSSSINIGLLNPYEILEKLKKVRSKIPLNSYEGLIRQYFWREYQRYCYIYLKEWHTGTKGYFDNKGRIPHNSKWYSGNTGVDPVDDAIKDAFNTGYLHHIRRLMIVANYMNLCGINHEQGRRWFTEFSLDSYDWVMYQNLDMGFFASGGKTSRKPYSSSSNYVRKMSNYKKGTWSDTWDKKYNIFVKKNKKKLWKYRYHFPTLNKL